MAKITQEVKDLSIALGVSTYRINNAVQLFNDGTVERALKQIHDCPNDDERHKMIRQFASNRKHRLVIEILQYYAKQDELI